MRAGRKCLVAITSIEQSNNSSRHRTGMHIKLGLKEKKVQRRNDTNWRRHERLSGHRICWTWGMGVLTFASIGTNGMYRGSKTKEKWKSMLHPKIMKGRKRTSCIASAFPCPSTKREVRYPFASLYSFFRTLLFISFLSTSFHPFTLLNSYPSFTTRQNTNCHTDMTTAEKPTVLIVGAGLGGLMLGALLEKIDMPYFIFECASAIKSLGTTLSPFHSLLWSRSL